MNEITKIHLGRQPFVIAVDAHKALQEYLRAIKKHMGNTDEAVEEVELRMAELLAERGVSGDKVVLLKDVDYLKQQLGEPDDFGDEESDEAADDSASPKRLFRDTEHGMLAGVCAGIANYLGIDALWVRLAFIALVLAGASGILLYIILWLVIPEAKTSSERLQMQGKPVTVDALKEVVERADVKGVAARASSAVGGVVQGVLKVSLVIIGSLLMAAGIALLVALVATSIYFFLNHSQVIPFGIFPVGRAEYALAGLLIVTAATVGLLLMGAGLSAVKRKLTFPAWALAVIFALFFSTAAVNVALVASVAPRVNQRYQAAHHSDVRMVKPFAEVNLIGDDRTSRDVEVERRISSDYKIELRYMGNADTSGVTVKETKPGVLEINTLGFASDPTCADSPCLFANSEFKIFIYAPEPKQITINGDGAFHTVIPGYPDAPDFTDYPPVKAYINQR